mmetsp:Transcript_31930/g.85267  ORF Transcript_31930/g.85267 Transcript_31930/m.85267 type:complete len:124 (-) Transcript_31930:278-649(-)
MALGSRGCGAGMETSLAKRRAGQQASCQEGTKALMALARAKVDPALAKDVVSSTTRVRRTVKSASMSTTRLFHGDPWDLSWWGEQIQYFGMNTYFERASSSRRIRRMFSLGREQRVQTCQQTC